MMDTLPAILHPLMECPSVETDACAVCGRPYPLNRHHVVRRGAGKLFRNGKEVPKPTVVLCGMGNTGGCHGLAHQNRLHFRNVDGKLAWRIFNESISYQEALREENGWSTL